MKVLVIGANGKTGQRVVRLLKQTGTHDAVAMIRHPEQRKVFDDLGVPTVLGDLEYPVDHAVRGCDAVIFAAGSGPKTGKDKTVLVDHLGAIRSMVAAAVNGARRYIMLSSYRSDPRSESPIMHYHRAKGLADQFLTTQHEVMPERLDWTIVRPGKLTEEPATGRVSMQPDFSDGATSRDHLALALTASLDAPATIGKSFDLFDGDTPVAEFLKTV